MALLGGSYVRPAGRCSNPPPPGTLIKWRAHAGIQAPYDSCKASGGRVRCLGTIGNDDHLKGCGGHTGHEPGKPIGVLHAIDLEGPGLGDFLLMICRSDEDTSMIQFINWRGGQYDYGGNRVGDSADQHLHYHRRAGRESEKFDFVARYLNVLDGGTDVSLTEQQHIWLRDTANRIDDLYNRRFGAVEGQLAALVKAAGDEVARDAAEREREIAEDTAERQRDVELAAAVEAVHVGDVDRLADLLYTRLGPDLAGQFRDALGQLVLRATAGGSP